MLKLENCGVSSFLLCMRLCKSTFCNISYICKINVLLFSDVDVYLEIASTKENSNLDFTCQSSISSSAPLTFQWLHNGTEMKNEVSPVLNLVNIRKKDGGEYYCIVTVNNISARSNYAQLHPLCESVRTQNTKTNGEAIAEIIAIILAIVFGPTIICCKH